MNMSRPYVKLDSENIVEKLLSELKKNMSRILSFDEIIGVMLDGGLSRGYGDHLSEIDVVIYLNKEQFLNYKKNKTPVPLGITKIDGYLYDIKIENYEDVLKRDFDMVALWDMSYGKVIYDPNNKLTELIKEKLSKPINRSQAEGLMFNAWWSYRLAGDIWINRNDITQGHFVLNNAIKPLISALFIANDEYIPHDKWIIHMSRTLDWKPGNWDDILVNIFSTGNFDLQSLISRQEIIHKLWTIIDIKLKEKIDLSVHYMQKYFFDTLELLIEKEKITIEEWEKISGFDILNTQPFHDIIYIKDETIYVDKNKIVSLGPEDMYEWFYEVLDGVRTQMRV